MEEDHVSWLDARVLDGDLGQAVGLDERPQPSRPTSSEDLDAAVIYQPRRHEFGSPGASSEMRPARHGATQPLT